MSSTRSAGIVARTCLLVLAIGLGFITSAPGPALAVEFASANVPKAVTDLTTVTSTVTVGQVDTVTDVNVMLDISHTFDADLDVFLIGPAGTRVELFTDVGGTGDGFTDTILDDEASTAITAGAPPCTGSFRPEGNLADFDGGPLDGTWTLEITDDGQGDVGALNAWSIIVTGAPTLTWAGTNGFLDDGVAPNSGVVGTQFTYKVKYTGASPDVVRLHLYYGGDEVAASPLVMAPVSGAPETGQVFMVKRVLSGTGPYAYGFSAQCGGTWATGTPTVGRAGPAVFTQPTLSWAGTNGFLDDGVAPNSGPAGTVFTYKVRYTGARPDFVRLRLFYNGAEVGVSPLAMSPITGAPETGQVFMVKRLLRATLPYAYRFEARCMGVWATGPPAQLTAGPVVTASSPSAVAMVGGLTCVAAGSGARAVFTLSAEAAVTAEVLNLAGRPIRTIVGDRQMPAGVNEVCWDGRSSRGLSVPSGTYLIRLTARTHSGAQAQALAMVPVVR